MTKNNKFIFATSNKGKLDEVKKYFANEDYTIMSLQDFQINSPVENANTFIGNALIKAQHASLHTNLPSLADDSGICVPALNGAPGLYSARFAGKNASDAENRALLLEKMKHLSAEQRQCYFIISLVYIRHYNDPDPIICCGKIHGYIHDFELGENGHGYDSIFYYPKLKKTFAQLDIQTKNKISHRGIALKTLIKELKTLKL